MDFGPRRDSRWISRPTECAAGWVEHGRKLALRHASGHRRINLQDALDLEIFKCPLFSAVRIDLTSTIAPLAGIEARNSDERCIHVIMDDARRHHAARVRRWLERLERRIKRPLVPG